MSQRRRHFPRFLLHNSCKVLCNSELTINRALGIYHQHEENQMRRLPFCLIVLTFLCTPAVFSQTPPPDCACESQSLPGTCLLYTSDAADERSSVDLGGRRII